MNHFIGQFYFVTEHSLYQVTVNHVTASPLVKKMAIRDGGRELQVPVGGWLKRGVILGITSRGIFKYQTSKRQKFPDGNPPKRVEESPGKGKGMGVFPPVGIFFRHEDADDCFNGKSTTTFDPRWHGKTREVLCAIGTKHPVITISTEAEFAVPEHLYKPTQ